MALPKCGLPGADSSKRMEDTPKALRLHIGFFGRRNVGKSSLLNALTRQDVSIVSAVAGTTTDPVEKAMELLPVGPVLFIDTAGVDDVGMLGGLRSERTRRVFDRTDMAIVVCASDGWSEFEAALVREFEARQTPVVVVFNKADLCEPDPEVMARLAAAKVPTVRSAVLVVPIDLEAPKGRLILPQVQTIRDILDSDAWCVVVKERELAEALSRLNRKPKLVITDSQAFLRVAGDTPEDIWLTSFSILFARLKGDLAEMVRGATHIDDLRPGDRVLVCEACTHHPIGDDIGRVKIPRWLMQYVGGELKFDHYSGHDFPSNISNYKLVIHCGACVHNRREMLSRIAICRHLGVPLSNYGLTIAYTLGIFERALQPFPSAREAYLEEQKKRDAK